MALAQEVKALIAENLGIKVSEVTNQARFKEDLGADSLDQVELTMWLEEKFNVEIPDEEAERLTTVGQTIEYLEKAINEKGEK